MATCHFWLDKIAGSMDNHHQHHPKNYKIVVYDTEDRPGIGGASAVAGGLVHPLSPRGKLVYQGLQGLQATNELIRVAQDAVTTSSAMENTTTAVDLDVDVVLSDCIWRCAQTPKHVRQLQTTSDALPEFCTWYDPEDMRKMMMMANDSNSNSSRMLGALRMSHGCCVIHVPSYLQAVWRACQQRVLSLNQQPQHECHVSLEWKQLSSSSLEQEKEDFLQYDDVVLSAGAGIFQDYLKPKKTIITETDSVVEEQHMFPIHLVRGQSIEFTSNNKKTTNAFSDAFLCGKYVSPLPPHHQGSSWLPRVLVGATHEFQPQAHPPEEVQDNLKRATEFMAPNVWDDACYTPDRITSGYRVQSQRGPQGRLPILGKLQLDDDDDDCNNNNNNEVTTLLLDGKNNNAWIYTGLSSRGLLYHALFGKSLVDAIWHGDESLLMTEYPELKWWKK